MFKRPPCTLTNLSIAGEVVVGAVMLVVGARVVVNVEVVCVIINMKYSRGRLGELYYPGIHE